jgi:hypothetical protein
MHFRQFLSKKNHKKLNKFIQLSLSFSYTTAAIFEFHANTLLLFPVIFAAVSSLVNFIVAG